jgi:hypothetical protein
MKGARIFSKSCDDAIDAWDLVHGHTKRLLECRWCSFLCDNNDVEIEQVQRSQQLYLRAQISNETGQIYCATFGIPRLRHFAWSFGTV